METWLRFFLRLPARPKDLSYIQKGFPELLWGSTDELSENLVEGLRHLRAFVLVGRRTKVLAEFREWLNPVIEQKAEMGKFKSITVKPSECPALSCPYKIPQWAWPQQNETSSEDESDEEVLRRLGMLLGGGNDRKPPKEQFLEMVRKHHSRTSVAEVILTDPYIYFDVSQDQQVGGFTVLIEYLRALGLQRENSFTLSLNPRAYAQDGDKPLFLQRAVVAAFPNATIVKFKSRHVFHDRLFLVRDARGIITGVFGPSVSGLNSQAMVLMGEFREDQSLQLLRKIFV